METGNFGSPTNSIDGLRRSLSAYLADLQTKLDGAVDAVKKERGVRMLKDYDESAKRAWENFEASIKGYEKYKSNSALYERAIQSSRESLETVLKDYKDVLEAGLKSIGL